MFLHNLEFPLGKNNPNGIPTINEIKISKKKQQLCVHHTTMRLFLLNLKIHGTD